VLTHHLSYVAHRYLESGCARGAFFSLKFNQIALLLTTGGQWIACGLPAPYTTDGSHLRIFRPLADSLLLSLAFVALVGQWCMMGAKSEKHGNIICKNCPNGKFIVGKRYKKKGFDVDLCESHFDELLDDEKLKYDEKAASNKCQARAVLVVVPVFLLFMMFSLAVAGFSFLDNYLYTDWGSASGAISGSGQDGDDDRDHDTDDGNIDYKWPDGARKLSKRRLAYFLWVGPIFIILSFVFAIGCTGAQTKTLHKNRFSGNLAFKTGWSGWSFLRRVARRQLFTILAAVLTPVMFVKDAFHEEQHFGTPVALRGPAASDTNNPRIAFASTVCSAVAINYQCYARKGKLKYDGDMYDCSDPNEVDALQTHEDIKDIDCFRPLDFSLINLLDVLGIAVGMIMLGINLFDHSEKWLWIGKIEKSSKEVDVDLEALADNVKSGCFACTYHRSIRAGIGLLFLIGGMATPVVGLIFGMESGWDSRQQIIEGGAMFALYICLATCSTFWLRYDLHSKAGESRQKILEILFRQYSSASEAGHWTTKSTNDLLAFVKPSTSFNEQWIKNELPHMSGADLWFSFDSRWKLMLKKKEKRNLDGKKAAITEEMNWSILKFASAVKNAMEKSDTAKLTFENVWFATWDIMDNTEIQNPGEEKHVWWMLGPTYVAGGQLTDQSKFVTADNNLLASAERGFDPDGDGVANNVFGDGGFGFAE
jgi:hypothetical protein